MLFVEPIFLFLYLPLVFGIYAVCPKSARVALLLAASLFFYAWGEGKFALIMVLSIALNYALGLLLEGTRATGWTKSLIVLLALLLNLLPLAYFKYAGFAARIAESLVGDVGDLSQRLHDVHLPIGISFFTFQGLSYVLDVASGRTPAQRSPLKVGLYIALFPQLIAGPIVRYTQLRDQLHAHALRWEQVCDGARRFVLGAGKKLLIANPMAEVADQIFALPTDQLTVAMAWAGAAAYTLQIYFDFSGYSDMAIGLGRMFGFRIPRNFNYPYIAQSITEFWRRWHISLSSWFRDYLYIPLGGNRGSAASTYRNLVIVFLLCGLWHGANWAFVAWGIYHGGFLILERSAAGNAIRSLPRPIRHAYALLVTMLGWVLFRAATGPIPGSDPLTYCLAYWARMFGLTHYEGIFVLSDVMSWLSVIVMAIGALLSLPVLISATRCISRMVIRNPQLGPIFASLIALGYILISAMVVLRAAADAYSPFIYFQF